MRTIDALRGDKGGYWMSVERVKALKGLSLESKTGETQMVDGIRFLILISCENGISIEPNFKRLSMLYA